MRAVFVDRDGTINVEKHFVHRINDFELIPGALEALQLLTRHGVEIYIVTNQSGIARGYYTEDDFHELTRQMLDYFRQHGVSIEKVLYCPHYPDGSVPEYAIECECRKPNTRLLEDVMEEKGLNPEEIAVFGDKNSDVEMGLRLGAVSYLVLTGYGVEHAAAGTGATHIMPDLLSAVIHLLGFD